ncbi:MAG TPA: hypothetical protein VFI25_18175 [Planctomycetota bacterium]|jgi:hypothetical protein|nr:hypothetical protein [Planctomycetota bacterium]
MRLPRTLALPILLSVLASEALPSDVVVPNAWTATQGPDNNSYPFNFFSVGGVGRYQQVYEAADFAVSGVSFPITITDLAFRPGQGAGGSYPLGGRTLTVSVSLSDSAVAPDAMSATFATNVSGAQTTVYAGALPFAPIPALPGSGPHPPVWTIPLQTPYVYTGGADLLLDLTITGSTASPGTIAPLDAINATGDAVARRFNQGNPGSPTANGGESLGLITRFYFGPSFAPFGVGCAGAGGFVPAIGSSGGDPALGNASFAITLSNATGGAAAFLAFGTSHVSWLGAPLPLDLSFFGATGCFLLVSVDGLVGTVTSGSGPGAGTALVPTPIPPNPALLGGRAFLQWAVLDPILGGILTSDAASVTVL